MFFLKFDKTMEEVKQALGHLPQAINLPLSRFHESYTKLPKEKPLYVYCRSGQRSRTAVKRLKDAGYANAYNIGGIIHWPYDTESR